jgi:septal ring factor EnvC (AmiA/AmiB activator)
MRGFSRIYRHIRDHVAPETCPLLDDVKKEIEYTLENYVNDSDHSSDLRRALETIEEIRKHNQKLRDALLDEIVEKERLEVEIDNVRDELKSALDENDELERELEDVRFKTS